MGPLQMNMPAAIPMAMPMQAMNMHQLQMPMQPREQLCSMMSSMQPFGFPMYRPY